jgi:hypothetical protein
MSAAKFLAFWELPKEALLIVTRGMALHEGTAKQLKRMPALDLVRDAALDTPHAVLRAAPFASTRARVGCRGELTKHACP